jgi:hypothetical protein
VRLDLDAAYTIASHKAIEYAAETKPVIYTGSIIAKRELILRKEEFRDLVYAED